MGSVTSRQNVGVEEVDLSINHAYKYPPKSGDNYFSNHFIMGGERFDTAYPEMYLFGENMDLNFLGTKPAPFPYPAPSTGEPSRTLKSLVNIRKESLRFVRVPDDSVCLKTDSDVPVPSTPSTRFNIEFTFDCDVRCAITILYFCTEEVTSSGLVYTPKDPSMNSETYHYKRGANQQFSQVCHVFDPVQHPEENLAYSFDKDVFPVVIYCVAEEGEEPFQSHATIAVVEKHSDGYCLKPLKQKLFVDGLCYLLQEIYGIENKNSDSKMAADDDHDDNGAECVICMCDLRDTLILPCRHLCLCNCCADSLRYQANNCPICRVPFRALLQIKSLQKITPGVLPSNAEIGENIPHGYESVSLIEALNGPSVAPQQPVAPPCQNMYVQLPQNVADSALDECVEERRTSLRRKHSKEAKLENLTAESEKTLPGMTIELDLKGQKGRVEKTSNDHAGQESLELEVKDTRDITSPLTSASNTKLKSKKSLEETAVDSSQEPDATQACSPAAVMDPLHKKRRKKSSHESHVFPSSPTHHSQFGENCNVNETDAEELTETLSLLEELKLKKGSAYQETRFQESEPKIADNNLSVARHAKNSPVQDDTREDPFSIENSHPLHRSNSYAEKGEAKPRSSKVTDQAILHSSDDCINLRHPADALFLPSVEVDSSNVTVVSSGAVTESQSLPGTPISRSSDISVSSASSTKALIMSNPSHFSTAV